MDSDIDAKWVKGVNSLLEASLLDKGQYAWGQNIDNAGGVIATRQGFNAIGQKTSRLPNAEPKGMAVFQDKEKVNSIVVAIGDKLYVSYSPFDRNDFIELGDGFTADDPVIFCRAFVSVKLNTDNTITALGSPYDVLVMQNGKERPIYWDGANLTTSDPSAIQPEIPVGKWMQWSGGRLWVASGNMLHASDLGNPLKFVEETLIAGGGALFFEDDITGMDETPSLTTLLVCTDYNTSVVQSTIYARETWGTTPGFQRVFLPGIGCAAGKSFVRHWGVVWWYAHGGLVNLDQAIQTYRTSRVRFRDQEMMRSKSNMAKDISGICMGAFGNYMLVSVPSGDKYNAHTWMINERVVDTGIDPYYGDPSEWAANWTGIHPVEYSQSVIDGQQRLFCLSRETKDGVVTPVVWECFTGERQDRFNDNIFSPPVMFETKILAMSADLKKFDHAEIDIAELAGMANMKVYVAGRRGGYFQIMDKQLVASKGSINSTATSDYLSRTTADFNPLSTSVSVTSTDGSLDAPSRININGQVVAYTAKTDTLFIVAPGQANNIILAGAQVSQAQFRFPNDPTIVSSFVPQRRMLKTSKWVIKPTDCQSPLESNLQSNVDRGFSLLIIWTGRLTITGLRVFFTKYDDQEQGRCEKDETMAAFLDEAGCGEITSATEVPTINAASKTSQYLRIITPRHNDILGYTPIP